jgi:hypothetical protein
VNRQQIRDAMERGAPFTIRMADGREYAVPHRDFISLSPRGGFAIVYDQVNEEGAFDILPLLTMTGLRQEGSPRVREEGE